MGLYVCVALLFSVYDELVLWYVPADVNIITRQLGMVMEVALGSPANGRLLL